MNYINQSAYTQWNILQLVKARELFMCQWVKSFNTYQPPGATITLLNKNPPISLATQQLVLIASTPVVK
jgi:hypothetical protein